MNGVCVYMRGCIHEDKLLFFFFPLLYFSSFQPFLLYLCFHLRDAACKKSSPSPHKQALGPCCGIRENGVHMVRRLAGLFSFPLLLFFGRHPQQVVTSARSEGAAVRVER